MVNSVDPDQTNFYPYLSVQILRIVKVNTFAFTFFFHIIVVKLFCILFLLHVPFCFVVTKQVYKRIQTSLMKEKKETGVGE